MSDAAMEVSTGSESVTVGTTTVDGMMGESSASTETTQTKQPETSQTGITRPSWMSQPQATAKEQSSESIAAASGPEATGQEGDGKADGDAAKADGQETKGEEAKSDTQEQGKPPAGFVPKEALSEARGEARYFKEQLTAREARIAELEAQLAAKPQVPAHQEKSEFDGFKVLSDEQLEELADEDPLEAANYAKKLVRYERHQADLQANEAKQAERAQHLGIQSGIAKNRISEILSSEEANAKLAKFATEIGMSQEAFILTDPDTQVLINGEPTPLNNIAANLVETLAAMMAKSSGQQEVTIEMVPDAVKEKIIAEAQEAILNKVKDPRKVRTVSSIPSVNRTAGGRFAGKSYGQLSPEEREAYLAGVQ